MAEFFQVDRVDRIADILYGVAVGEGVIGYGPLAKRIDIPPHFLGQLLDQVSHRAANKDEPLWSALVVGKDTKRPHDGFYGLARRMRPEYAGVDNEQVWTRECDRCYASAR
jgi:hypothetical protein